MKISISRGLRIRNYRNLTPILNQWQTLLFTISKEWLESGEVPWWFNERASLSIFSGAIWKRGGSVFEEFSVNRTLDTDEGVKLKYGRCDMEFYYKGKYYLVEAKQNWPTFGKRRSYKTISNIRIAIRKAKREVNQVIEPNQRGMGLVFIVPRINYSIKFKETEIITNLLNKLSIMNNVSIAWIFPRHTRTMRPNEGSRNHKYIYPGVILAYIKN